jgi:hypothetical protein
VAQDLDTLTAAALKKWLKDGGHDVKGKKPIHKILSTKPCPQDPAAGSCGQGVVKVGQGS